MDIIYAVIVVLGLVVFETIASIDNAIINADILSTMSAWAKRWFLTWGLIIAVFGVRGVLPWLIIWFSTPSLGPIGALTATFSDDATAAAAIEASAPFLLLAGGMFMVLLFLHWLMAEQKNCIVPGELALSKQAHGSMLLPQFCFWQLSTLQYRLTHSLVWRRLPDLRFTS